MVVAHQVDGLYDPVVVRAVQDGLEAGYHGGEPFFYPPPMMFLVAPLGWLSQPVGFACWMVLGSAVFMVATFRAPPRPGAALLFLVLPGTAVTAAFGQSGLFAGAILLGGLYLVPSRRTMGLLAIKPQLDLLLPVALLAAGQARAIAAATLSAGVLCLLSAACFGWRPWLDWVHSLRWAELQWHTDAGTLFPVSPTPTASLTVTGMPWPLIHGIQLAAALFSILVVWRVCRTGLDGRAIVVVCAAGFLASPHGFVYDMPALCAAVLILLCEREAGGIERWAAFGAQVLPVLAATVAIPFLMPAIVLFALLSFAAPRLGTRIGVHQHRRISAAPA